MSLTLKTQRAQDILSYNDKELVSAINAVLNDKNCNEDLVDDIKTIQSYILSNCNTVFLDTKKLYHGKALTLEKPKPKDRNDPKKTELTETLYHFDIDVSDFDTFVALKYLNTQISASSRGIEFNLTLSEMRNILKRKTCYYSGAKFTDKNKLTLDRKDNKIGYVSGNVVACSHIINSMKSFILENDNVKSTVSDKEVKKTLTNFISLLGK